MSERAHELGDCHNCGAAVQGQFCAVCGQEKRPLDPSLKEILGEFAQEISDADGRLLRSLRKLFSSPGFLTREHFEGRRAAWLPPVRFYLVVSIVYFAVSALTGEGGSFDLSVTGETEEDALAELQSLGFSSEAELDRAIADAEATWMPRVMFVLMPILAGLVHLAQRRTRRHYPHHLIFSLHVHTAWFAAFTVTGLVASLVANELASAAFGIAALLYAAVYLTLALQRVYGGGWLRAIGHSLLIGSLYSVATILVTAAVIVPFALAAGS